MADYYDALLRLCGFEDDDIKREQPRADKAFERLELGTEDMKTAEEWVRQNHDVELVGVQRLLRGWILELFDLVLAKDEGKKVVYYGFPSIQGPGMAIKAASKDEIYVACPDAILCHTLGQIFDKLTPILEAGEQNGLPPGHGLCSLQQIRVGAMAKGIIPVPDLVTGSSYYCDMGSKSDELLKQKYGQPAIYVDGSMDSRWGEYPGYLPERVEFMGAQLNKLFDKVKEVLGVEVTRDDWDKAQSISRHIFSGIGQLTKLMKADPVPVSAAEQELAQILATASTGRAMTEVPEALDILVQEVKKRVDEGIGVVEKGAPRVMIFIAPFSDASIMHMMEDAGLAVGATLLTVPPPKVLHPTSYTTLGEIIAEREMTIGIYHSSFGIAKRFEDAARSLNMDGVICAYQFNCRPLALPSHFLKKWVEEEAGVPTLSLEFDMYDSRNYSAASLRTKVETFADMLRARKAFARV